MDEPHQIFSKPCNFFQVFDKNGNGRISMAELGEMLTNLGKSVPTKVATENCIQSVRVKQERVHTFEFDWTCMDCVSHRML